MHTLNSFIIIAAFIANRVITHPGSLDSVLVPARAQELQRRAISPDVLLNNGKLAQGLNAKYATMTMGTSCKEGDHACLQGGFAQCVSGKYVSLGCSPPTVCFELPLLLKPGSVPTCTTPADAAARIANTGVQGGVKGDGTETPAGSNSTSPIADAPSLNGTDMGMGDMSNNTMSMNTTASDATPDLSATSTANTTDSESSDVPSADSADEDASSASAANATLPDTDVNNSTATQTNSNSTDSVDGASNVTLSNATDSTSADSNTTVSTPTVSQNSTEPKAVVDTKASLSTNSTDGSGVEDCVED
ncbi:uncharacterized protein MELLADRAFT_87085 [Melampsora larici-populina 98AG31]|uniref:Carbohydrate-binding module family 19 domain-containing protein n=1 Tax=Melampsora larici-populina (strain 98AG31 / pathotype 3-4-7) TaxID=747676 RepID=F4R4G6_MELLP|nr:uncharacterized protein MELLADRAFT_87085 [Melampsora larici-populina 98AG31]EGG12806.1 hypothetical protein MELLADRAFT_87085 [Melampsora larici-populina 98AG31]